MQNYTENRQNGITGEDLVFRSLAMIEERIREKLTVKSLADSVHFSKYHYQRMFREVVGDSVMGYVARRRLSLAAKELAETDASVLEIALRYGYDSHEGFTRSFKSYMGITPTEYRKYHLSTNTFQMRKERSAMIYSKATDEMIRELNALIVQAKETAAYTRKSVGENTGIAEFYSRFWDVIAGKTESLAEKLSQILARIADIAQQPDEISARFMIIKAMEDTAFQSGITAFQAGLTMARARPEHREAFLAVCDKYESLARNARFRTGRVVEFMQELWLLIFQDIRKNVERIVQQTVEMGMAAARDLSGDPALPYGYIADEIRAIAEEISSTPIEEIAVCRLEDYLFQLDIIAFSADVDALRVPDHRPLFDGIQTFREQIVEMTEFFQSLTGNAACTFAEAVHAPAGAAGTSAERGYNEQVFWSNILLFYLKGEIQKLGENHLTEKQEAVFDGICNKMEEAFRNIDETDCDSITEILGQVYQEMTDQAQELGIYGAPIRYIAEELQQIFLKPGKRYE